MATKKKNTSFEENIKKLEDIVQGLEHGDLSLENSIKSFEEGVKLYKECQVYLNKAEKKIKVLTDDLKEINFEDSGIEK